ncbi:hypothetical protein G5I_12328 [Acromyrmex echinatior]|uniref:Uncharacterized protein n=1 Tax=Acromyrmex echinatior TaxID=103372 RepID=F4X209_ACREC|nr:hypothetical protein G5I_12328 [Acromyrmex echinatior]
MTDHLCICAPVDTDRSVTVADRIPRGARASRKRNGVANGETRCAGDFVFRQQPTITTRTTATATATTCYRLGGTRRTASSIAAPCPEIICAIVRTATSYRGECGMKADKCERRPNPEGTNSLFGESVPMNTRITTDWATGVINKSRNKWKECVTMSNDVLNMPGRARVNDSGNSDKRGCGCMERVGNASPLSNRLDRVSRDWAETLRTSLFVLNHCSN